MIKHIFIGILVLFTIFGFSSCEDPTGSGKVKEPTPEEILAQEKAESLESLKASIASFEQNEAFSFDEETLTITIKKDEKTDVDTVTLEKDFTLPKHSTLEIKKNSTLEIGDVILTLEGGTIEIEKGGTLNFGDGPLIVNSDLNRIINDSDSLIIPETIINEGSHLAVAGIINFENIDIQGFLDLLESTVTITSEEEISGSIIAGADSIVIIEAEEISGSITVNKDAVVNLNSGEITGTISVLSSGEFHAPLEGGVSIADGGKVELSSGAIGYYDDLPFIASTGSAFYLWDGTGTITLLEDNVTEITSGKIKVNTPTATPTGVATDTTIVISKGAILTIPTGKAFGISTGGILEIQGTLKIEGGTLIVDPAGSILNDEEVTDVELTGIIPINIVLGNAKWKINDNITTSRSKVAATESEITDTQSGFLAGTYTISGK
jgi:hypothetical protein